MGEDDVVVCSDFLPLLDPVTDAIDAVIDVETFNHEIDQEKQDAASLETTRRRVHHLLGDVPQKNPGTDTEDRT